MTLIVLEQDFTVFLAYIGIASSDLSFSRTQTDPVYHYHSNYDR